MIFDQFLADVAAIYATDSAGKQSFGSGRLIAPGLILTAGHVVDHPSRQAAISTGWAVCLIGERSVSGMWMAPPHSAELVWRGSGELDLALLRLTDAPSLAPRSRIVFASWGVMGFIDSVEAAGFPQAWGTRTTPTRDYTLSGRLRIATQRGPYAWTVAQGDKPDSRDGWKGMSGGTACKLGPNDTLHILGVLQEVAANFSGGQVSVGRLSFAFADLRFRRELRACLEREPQIVPWIDPIHNNRLAAPQRRLQSTISALRQRPFVGREDLFEKIGESLGDPFKDGVVVLHGPAGVGKSELAQEFARRNQPAYPGGTFFLDGGGTRLATQLADLGSTVLDISFSPRMDFDEQGLQTFRKLGSAPTLLIYDNVQSVETLENFLPYAGMPCHIVITTLLDRWSLECPAFHVPEFSREETINLVERTIGPELADRYALRLVEFAAGLPVQIIPDCGALRLAADRGDADTAFAALLSNKTKRSFDGAYQLLAPSAKLLVQAAARLNPQRIPRDELERQIVNGAGWQPDTFRGALNACLDFQVLQGIGELRMHQLFCKFVLDTPASDDLAMPLAAIVQTQAARMVEVALELVAHPNHAGLAALLMVFSPDHPAHWCEGDAEVSIADGEVVGRALMEVGLFMAAQLWFERAVKAKEHGDIHGRIDHASLGGSLHRVGYCLLSQGQFAAAQPWFERAVKEQDDIHGRVDHASLGRSLHQVGYCLSRRGRFAAAQSWFERAVKAKEHGDIHGRVDHESLGASLHQVGDCLASQGQLDAARPWFERAVKAKEQGDVHGRVDHTSLGRSLHQVGDCLASQGPFEAAQPWLERAVKAAEQGDIHGRVDHESLGRSLHQMGDCLASQGQFAAAQPWFERAVKAKEQGDIHGRVDHESLGGSLHEVGYCLASQGQLAAAQPWFERAVAATEQGDIHGRVDHANLGRSLLQVGLLSVEPGPV